MTPIPTSCQRKSAACWLCWGRRLELARAQDEIAGDRQQHEECDDSDRREGGKGPLAVLRFHDFIVRAEVETLMSLSCEFAKTFSTSSSALACNPVESSSIPYTVASRADGSLRLDRTSVL